MTATQVSVSDLLSGTIHGLPAVDLETVVAAAALNTRVDRKYIARPDVAAAVVSDLAYRMAVLEMGGCRAFNYESTYFDTEDLRCFRDAAHDRRRRFKVRTRAYLDSRSCALEVKTRGGRGETVKRRMPYDFDSRRRLDPDARHFVAAHVNHLSDVIELMGALTTTYERSTLLDVHARSRVTLDAGLVCALPDGGAVRLSHQVIVETKSPGPATLFDRSLWAFGCRPVSISKYCVGLAALKPELPSNKWHRTLHRYFR